MGRQAKETEVLEQDNVKKFQEARQQMTVKQLKLVVVHLNWKRVRQNPLLVVVIEGVGEALLEKTHSKS